MKKIIIVGAGIAGLSAGCYAQMNGYDAEIYEMHDIPGGLCTAWSRKGYLFDGCIHFLVGTSPSSMLHAVWNEVGALKGKHIVNHDVYMEIRGKRGEKLVLYCDIDKLEAHMKELSPADGAIIQELADAIRNFSLAGSSSVPANGDRIRQMSMQAFVQELHDPFLKGAFSIFNDMNFFLMSISSYSKKDAGWPIGGSLEFARGIEKRFLELGGRIRYRAKAVRILVEENRAAGVLLADGTGHIADYVISAADGHSTVFEMIEDKYVGDEIKTLYANASTYPTTIQISLGVNCDLSNEPHSIFVQLDEPVRIAGAMREGLLFEHYCYDKTMCPQGKSIVTSTIYSGYEYWQNLRMSGGEAYRLEKERTASAVIGAFETQFPQAKGKVEVADVATPLTYNRYTGAWKGAYMGWMSTPQYPVVQVPSEIPGLKGFYMAGQWTHARGGLPTALMTARGAIKKICAEDGCEFASNR